MMNRPLICLIAIIASANLGAAQSTLTPEEALRIALERNYGIIIADNEAQIARINNTPGSAGMLPYASIVATDNFLSNEPPVGGSAPASIGRHANTLNLAARIDWTLFDGGRMFIAKDRLTRLDSIGALGLRATVMQTHADVLDAYYGIVRQKQQLVFINEVLALNRERLAIAQTSFGAGLVPKTILLQAMIDLNVYRENAIAQQNVIVGSKRALNVLLCRDGDSPFDVIDSIPLLPIPDRTALLRAVDSSNISLKVLRRQVEIAELNLRESRALLLPELSVNAGYAISNNVGINGSGGAWGPQAGASLTVPLYQAGNGVRQVKASSLNARSAAQQLLQERNLLSSRAGQLLDDFESQRRMLVIERENALLAKENLDISMQQMRLGQTTMIELRLAEESYADSRNRLLSIEFNLKVAETTLKLLMAKL